MLLGALVRWPHLASPIGWATVVVGLPLENMIYGGLPAEAIGQASADLVGIVTG